MPTAVTSWGVKPTNQASLLLSFVPVLPATGRTPKLAAVPVPLLTTSWSATTASAAASALITWRSTACSGSTTRPVLAATTLMTVCQSTCLPALAKIE